MAKENVKNSGSIVPGSKEEMQKLFDQGGGQEVHFDRPLVSFKVIKENLVRGFLLGRRHLTLPAGQEDLREEDDDAVVDINAQGSLEAPLGMWSAFIIRLTEPCLARVGTETVTVEAGREVYLAETSKNKELINFILADPNIVHHVMVMHDGTIPRPGGREIQKYRIKVDAVTAQKRDSYSKTFLGDEALKGRNLPAGSATGVLGAHEHGTVDLRAQVGGVGQNAALPAAAAAS